MFSEEIYFLTNCSIFCTVMSFIQLTHFILPTYRPYPRLKIKTVIDAINPKAFDPRDLHHSHASVPSENTEARQAVLWPLPGPLFP